MSYNNRPLRTRTGFSADDIKARELRDRIAVHILAGHGEKLVAARLAYPSPYDPSKIEAESAHQIVKGIWWVETALEIFESQI